MQRALLAVLALLALLPACDTNYIPNTQVPDTAPNREVVEFVEGYRHAIEARSPAQVLRLVSERYYDDMGTPSADDDIDYGMLRDRIGRLEADVVDVRYEIRYRRVIFEADRVFVDYTYTASFKVRTAEGERWSRRLADNRIELVLEGGAYRISSGL